MLTTVFQRAVEEQNKKAYPQKPFVPGVSPVPVSGKVYDEQELLLGVEAVLDGWWTEGRFELSLSVRLPCSPCNQCTDSVHLCTVC